MRRAGSTSTDASGGVQEHAARQALFRKPRLIADVAGLTKLFHVKHCGKVLG